MKILIVDNNDSFTYNLQHWIVGSCGVAPDISRYDCFNPNRPIDYDWVIISAGPGHPREYPKYKELFCRYPRIPVLGICLGMQIINCVFGGTVIPLTNCVHGQDDLILLDNRSYLVARYHSLALGVIASDFEILAKNQAGVAMCMQHIERPILGYQFHPESFLTENSNLFFDYAYQRLIEHQATSVFTSIS